MSYCSKCGAEINPGARYCSKCGNPVNTEQTGKKEEFQDNGESGESFWGFLSQLIELTEKTGAGITAVIDKVLHIEPDKPKDSQCPYCDSEDTFPIAKNEMEVKSKGYSLGSGVCGMCLLGPFGLLCGLCGTGSKVNSRTTTWWGCKGCGKQHLAQHDAVEMLNSFMDKMLLNCLCYGAIGSLFLYPLLGEFVQGFLRTILAVIIAGVAGVLVPSYLAYQLFNKIGVQLGYSPWEILESQKKKEYWNNIKMSMIGLGITLLLTCPVLWRLAE